MIVILVVISYVVINNFALAQIGEPWIVGLDSPLKQFKSGIKAENVKCQPYYFVPVIKSEDGTPACVTPQTAQKLDERKWTTLENSQTYPISEIKIIGLQQTYRTGQPIIITVNYTGFVNGGIEPDVVILDNDHTQVWTSCCFSHTETVSQHPGISIFNVQGPKIVKGVMESDYPVINKTGTYTIVASLENKKTETKFVVSNETNQILPVSFEECNTPYEYKQGFIPVLYLPTNSVGKVCVNYSNGNDPTTVTPRVFDAQNLSMDTQDISVSPLQANIVHGNSTIVYTVTSGSKAGFYGLTIFCFGTPIAVGYDNQSRIITGDFPWLHQTFYCPLRSYDYHIVGVGGEMGIKYVSP